jgi:septum formation inhibitor MinC
MGILTSSLSEQDQKTFYVKTSKFCLEDHTPPIQDLVVTSCSSITLSASPKDQSYTSPIWLETRDLDVLKRWIGVNDETIKGRNLVSCEAQRLMKRYQKMLNISEQQLKIARQERQQVSDDKRAALQATATQDIAAAVKESGSRKDSELSNAIRDYTKNYLYGDSRLVKEMKPLLESHFEIFKIPVWFFLTVTVKSGSTLYFGPGSNVLVAHELRVEPGGKVRSYGNLTVDVTNLRKSALLQGKLTSDLFNLRKS